MGRVDKNVSACSFMQCSRFVLTQARTEARRNGLVEAIDAGITVLQIQQLLADS